MADKKRPRPDWGDPDPAYILEQRERERTSRERMVEGTRKLLVFGLVATVLALFGGYLLARSSPQVAARLLVRDAVVTEPFGTATDGPAPTSGSNEFGVTTTCGPSEEVLSLADQRRAIYSGVVIVQVRDEADLGDARAWASSVEQPVITAPNPDLDDNVVATAWTRRMTLPSVNRELLTGFVIAHGLMGPERAIC